MKNLLLVLAIACLTIASQVEPRMYAQDQTAPATAPADQTSPPANSTPDNPANTTPPDSTAPAPAGDEQPATTEPGPASNAPTAPAPAAPANPPAAAAPAAPPAATTAPAPANASTNAGTQSAPSKTTSGPGSGYETAPSSPGEDTSKATDRVQAAAAVLKDIMEAPDKGIPEDVLDSARCVSVVPSMLKGGFVVGGAYGRGVASCRTTKGWSAPAFFDVKGGSFGLQIGGQAVDLVMLIMNDNGMKNLLSSKFKLGADASVAAGPVGREASGNTDWKMRAQVLSYSRARGVFAGINLNGAAIKQDKDSTREFYGRMVPFRTTLTGQIPPPAAAKPFLDVLSTFAKQAADKK
jgi:lipid-binding SYLF domain-containing protein